MPLTDAQIRALQPSQKRCRCSDGGGLFIEVLPSGKKVFRLAYRLHGGQRTKMIGDYPRTTLADARLKAAAFKIDLKSGDPEVVEQATKKQSGETPTDAKKMTWKEVANDYLLLRQQSGPAPQTLSKLNRQIGITIEALGTRLSTAKQKWAKGQRKMLPLWGCDNHRIDERQHPGSRACPIAGGCPDALARQGQSVLIGV